MELEEIMNRLRTGDEIHLEERARLLMQIGGLGVGGIELSSISEHAGEITPEIAKQAALEHSMKDLWSDAFICYGERGFRACVILLACLVEATLSLEVEKRGVEGLTLGLLIDYCYKNNMIPKKVCRAAKEVNRLRNLVVHLKIERKWPMKAMETIPDLDEEVPLKVFKKPPVIVSKEGGISGDDAIFVWHPGFAGVLYKYKKASDKAFKNVRFILRSLYDIKFNTED